MVGVGPIDRLSGQPDGTIEVPCPACAAGDQEAVWRAVELERARIRRERRGGAQAA
jgi:hypothetical protein